MNEAKEQTCNLRMRYHKSAFQPFSYWFAVILVLQFSLLAILLCIIIKDPLVKIDKVMS